jgi:hypothetical protein
MAELFACDDPKADLAYLNMRAPKREGAARARANCDELWRDFEPFASAHFLAEFPFRFHQRWFEMYLAVALLQAGLEISCPKGNAPDVRVQLRDGRALWLEAIAPTGGETGNPDRIVYPPKRQPGEPAVAYRVPIDQVTLRVSGALHDKAKKIKTYRDRAIIAHDEQALIAINVNRIPHGLYDAERYALGATYGVGPLTVTFDRGTAKVVESGYTHQAELLRSSGNSVDTAPFLHPGLEHVTGALVSSVDAANCPRPLGLDFMLLPNPEGAPAYSELQLAIGREWRLHRERDAYRLEVIEHSRRRGDGV